MFSLFTLSSFTRTGTHITVTPHNNIFTQVLIIFNKNEIFVACSNFYKVYYKFINADKKCICRNIFFLYIYIYKEESVYKQTKFI